jgi:hypothetical protein
MRLWDSLFAADSIETGAIEVAD